MVGVVRPWPRWVLDEDARLNDRSVSGRIGQGRDYRLSCQHGRQLCPRK